MDPMEEHNGEIGDNPTRIQFLCSINDDESEEIISFDRTPNFTSDTWLYLFTAYVKPLVLPRSLVSTMSMVYGTPLIF
jgi:hypothetical protein